MENITIRFIYKLIYELILLYPFWSFDDADEGGHVTNFIVLSFLYSYLDYFSISNFSINNLEHDIVFAILSIIIAMIYTVKFDVIDLLITILNLVFADMCSLISYLTIKSILGCGGNILIVLASLIIQMMLQYIVTNRYINMLNLGDKGYIKRPLCIILPIFILHEIFIRFIVGFSSNQIMFTVTFESPAVILTVYIFSIILVTAWFIITWIYTKKEIC